MDHPASYECDRRQTQRTDLRTTVPERAGTTRPGPLRTTLVVILLIAFFQVASGLLAPAPATAAFTTKKVSTSIYNTVLGLSWGRAVWFGVEPGVGYKFFVHNVGLGTTAELPGAMTATITSADFEGDHIALTEGVPLSDPYLYDIGARTRIPLGAGAGDEKGANVHNGRMVWNLHDGFDWEVMRYDIASGSQIQLTNDKLDQEGPAFDGDWLVTYGCWQAGAPDTDISLDNMATGSSRHLWSIDNDSDPHIEGNNVIWQSDGMITGHKGIWLHDIAANVTKRISPSGTDSEHPVLSRGRVVWQSRDAQQNTYHVYLYDIASGSTTKLTGGTGGRNPYILGSEVVWLTDAGPGTTEVWYKSLTSGMVDLVTSQTQTIGDVFVEGETVAWSADGVYVSRLGSSPPPPPPPSNQPFSDVPSGHVYFTAIDGLRQAGVADGYPDNTFRPDNNLWRAPFTKLLVRGIDLRDASGDPPQEGMDAPFGDLGRDDPTDLYPHQYVAVAAQRGVVLGTGPRTFSPWTNVTRAQMVTMAVRAANAVFPEALTPPPPRYAGTLGTFHPVHGPAMATAEYNRLLDGLAGFGPGWDPWKSATRGECAQIVWNLRREVLR